MPMIPSAFVGKEQTELMQVLLVVAVKLYSLHTLDFQLVSRYSKRYNANTLHFVVAYARFNQ